MATDVQCHRHFELSTYLANVSQTSGNDLCLAKQPGKSQCMGGIVFVSGNIRSPISEVLEMWAFHASRPLVWAPRDGSKAPCVSCLSHGVLWQAEQTKLPLLLQLGPATVHSSRLVSCADEQKVLRMNPAVNLLI